MEHNKTARKQMVPVIPKWCDYHEYTPIQKIIFIGVTRIILSLIAIGYCVAYLSVFESTSAEKITVGFIMVLSIIHVFVSLYFIYAGRSGNQRLMGQWLIVDVVVSTIFIILVIVLLCIAPTSGILIFLGSKLIFVSVLMCYMFSMKYMDLLGRPVLIS